MPANTGMYCGECEHVLSHELSVSLLRLVIEALKGVDPNRKCFRLIGGVLVERKVEEVLPPLEKNKEMVSVKAKERGYFYGNLTFILVYPIKLNFRSANWLKI